MGKKYDAYEKAAQAEGVAKSRLSAAEGGSTKDGMKQAQNDAQSAEVISNVLWQEFLDDPQG